MKDLTGLRYCCCGNRLNLHDHTSEITAFCEDGFSMLVWDAVVVGQNQGVENHGGKEVWVRWDGNMMSGNEQERMCHQSIHVSLHMDDRNDDVQVVG